MWPVALVHVLVLSLLTLLVVPVPFRMTRRMEPRWWSVMCRWIDLSNFCWKLRNSTWMNRQRGRRRCRSWWLLLLPLRLAMRRVRPIRSPFTASTIGGWSSRRRTWPSWWDDLSSAISARTWWTREVWLLLWLLQSAIVSWHVLTLLLIPTSSLTSWSRRNGILRRSAQASEIGIILTTWLIKTPMVWVDLRHRWHRPKSVSAQPLSRPTIVARITTTS